MSGVKQNIKTRQGDVVVDQPDRLLNCWSRSLLSHARNLFYSFFFFFTRYLITFCSRRTRAAVFDKSTKMTPHKKALWLYLLFITIIFFHKNSSYSVYPTGRTQKTHKNIHSLEITKFQGKRTAFIFYTHDTTSAPSTRTGRLLPTVIFQWR